MGSRAWAKDILIRMKTIAITLGLMVAAPVTALTDAECAVWQREQAFAQTVIDKDAEAFRAHLHADAVFFGPAPARGGDAAAASWAGIIAAGELRWHPREVVVAGDTGVALSRGPYWFPDSRPDATTPYAAGQFLSIWKRDEDGEWRVLFDGAGATAAKPITESELETLVAGLSTDCAP